MENIKLVFDTRGNERQKEALAVLLDPNHPCRNLWYGGAAGWAKTFTGIFWQWTMRQRYPGTRGFFARNELKRIKESTYLSYLEFCDIYKIPDHQIGKWNEKYSKIVFQNKSEIVFVDLQYKPRDPLYLRVWSMLFTDGFFEESNEINGKGVEMLATRVGRWKNEKYGLPGRTLETFNPDKGHVYRRYWIPYKKGEEEPRYKFIKALLDDNKYLGKEYRDNLLNKSKITRERLLYGNFEYDDSPGKMFQYDPLHDLKTNPIAGTGKKYITCDPARKGRDRAVIAVWDGFKIIDSFTFKKCGLDEIEKKILEFAEKYHIPMRQVIVDEDGLGGGIIDHLKCKGFVNGGRTIDTRTAAEKRDGKQLPNFQNLKTQCYFMLATAVENSEINIAGLPEEDQECLIEELDIICEEDIDKDGKKKITPKEKIKEDLGRSPDWADNVMMRMWFEIAPKKTAAAF